MKSLRYGNLRSHLTSARFLAVGAMMCTFATTASAVPLLEIKQSHSIVKAGASYDLENGGTQTQFDAYFGPTVNPLDVTQETVGSAVVGARGLDTPGADADDIALTSVRGFSSAVVSGGQFRTEAFAKAARTYGPGLDPTFPLIDGVTTLHTADVFARYTLRVLDDDVSFFGNVFSGGQGVFSSGSYYAPASLRIVNRTTGTLVTNLFIDDTVGAEDVMGVLEAGNTYSVYLRTRIVDTVIADFDDEEPQVLFNVMTDNVKVPAPATNGLLIAMLAIGFVGRRLVA